jgi:hypothetical protein
VENVDYQFHHSRSQLKDQHCSGVPLESSHRRTVKWKVSRESPLKNDRSLGEREEGENGGGKNRGSESLAEPAEGEKRILD